MSAASRDVTVFFGRHLSRPVSRRRLAVLLAPLGDAFAQQALVNLRRLRRRHPGLEVLSVRELFAGAESLLRTRAQALFCRAGLLQPFGREVRAPHPDARVRYGGTWPAGLASGQARWLFRQMGDMQETAAAVLREGMAISSSHIVLSACRGRFLTITATDTDKSRVGLYAHTPLAAKAGRDFVYFGDPHFPPSSELASHWTLHAALRPWLGAESFCILHFHHAGLRAAARPGEALRLGKERLPCIVSPPYGSAALGRAMARALRAGAARAVTVADHGTWFVGKSFPAALRRARGTVRRFSLTYPRNQC